MNNFMIKTFRNNIELLLMNRGIIENETKDENFFSSKRLFKNVPTAIIYNLCYFAVKNHDRELVVEMMSVLDPHKGGRGYGTISGLYA